MRAGKNYNKTKNHASAAMSKLIFKKLKED
jgi:hypothetical protein